MSTVAVPPTGDRRTATRTATNRVLRLPRKQHTLLLQLHKDPTKNSSNQLGDILGLKKYAISRLTTALSKKGYLIKIRGIPSFYELTKKGISYCCSFPGEVKEGSKFNIRLHGPLTYISKIMRKPPELEKRLEANNFIHSDHASGRWYRSKMFRVGVMFTPSTVHFHMPEIYGDEYEVYGESMNLLYEVLAHLESEYPGLRLGTPHEVARISRQEVAIRHAPLAIEYKRTGDALGKKLLYYSDRQKIDTSGGVPEQQFHNKIFAPEDLHKVTQVYEDMIRGDFDVADFSRSLEEIKALQQGGLNTVQALTNINNIMAATIKTLTGEVMKLRKEIKKRQARLNEF